MENSFPQTLQTNLEWRGILYPIRISMNEMNFIRLHLECLTNLIKCICIKIGFFFVLADRKKIKRNKEYCNE